MAEEIETPPRSSLLSKVSHGVKSIRRRSKQFFRHLDSFKKVSAIIGLIGVTIGAIWGGYQIVQAVIQAKETQEEIEIRLSVANRFAERFEYERAIKEYEKIFELDRNNVEAHRHIIMATRKQFQLTSDAPQQEVDDALAQIYRVQALDPSLQGDLGLLLEEAFLLKVDRRFEAAITVLGKAHSLYPQAPAVLAELGYLRGLTSPDGHIEGLDLLRRATELRPSETRYYYYLAQIAEKADLNAEAIRAYAQTAKLAVGRDIWSKGVRKRALTKVLHIFYYRYGWEKLLDTELDMPLEERAEVLEYFVENSKPDFRSANRDPYLYLARIYYELADLESAAHALKAGLPDDKSEWRQYGYLLKPLATILEKGGSDPSMLEEVRALLEAGVSNFTSVVGDVNPDDFFIGDYLK